MGKKPIKTYREPKVRLDVFKNKNCKGSTYFIFKLFLYTFSKPKPVFLRKHIIYQLKKILDKIEIKGYDEEEQKEEPVEKEVEVGVEGEGEDEGVEE